MRQIIDMHNHSSFSEDSEAPMGEMIERAAQLGLKGIAITDHVDNNPGDEGFQYFNEKEYSREFELQKTRFNSELKVLKGVEFDAPHLYPDQFKFFTEIDYDVLIGSVHMIDDAFVGDREKLKHLTLEELFNAYYRNMLTMVESGGFDILAHMDFPTRYYHSKNGDPKLIDAILEMIIDKNIALEINTSPLRKDYNETSPGLDILKRFNQLGGQLITIGSDAHFPRHIMRDFDYVFNMLKGLPRLVPGYFQNREFYSL